MPFCLKTVVEQNLADTDTPVGVYLKLRDHFPESILFENATYPSPENHYSFICCQPLAGITVADDVLHTYYPDGKKFIAPVSHKDHVVTAVTGFLKEFRVTEADTRFPVHGLFGYFNYDAVRHFEDIKLKATKTPGKSIPEVRLAFYRFLLLFDHLKNELTIMEYYPEGTKPQGTAGLKAAIRRAAIPAYPFRLNGTEHSQCTDDEFLEMVARGKKHCFEGDVFQVVLSREFSRAYKGDDFNVYRALRSINPSPYLFYCDYGAYRIFGSSPEAQLKMEQGQASIHPIAGTYRRSGDRTKDQQAIAALKEDKKENAEHVMLVDLARNDLSKKYRKVHVRKDKEIQQLSHVIHLVSEVVGEDPLTQDSPAIQILADTFPAGTLSGAPKYKAMQLIDQYEFSSRGFYGGSVGFIGFDGSINQAIMIRSFLSKGNRLYYRAGAGIVAASVAENELQEVHNKLAALRKALLQAENI